MSFNEEQLKSLIGWKFQQLFSWLGIAIGSSIGLLEIISTIERFALLRFIAYHLLIIPLILSLEKMLVHQKELSSYQIQLKKLKKPEWKIPEVEGFFQIG